MLRRFATAVRVAWQGRALRAQVSNRGAEAEQGGARWPARRCGRVGAPACRLRAAPAWARGLAMQTWCSKSAQCVRFPENSTERAAGAAAAFDRPLSRPQSHVQHGERNHNQGSERGPALPHRLKPLGNGPCARARIAGLHAPRGAAPSPPIASGGRAGEKALSLSWPPRRRWPLATALIPSAVRAVIQLHTATRLSQTPAVESRWNINDLTEDSHLSINFRTTRARVG